jgi:hypothetical protein
MVSVARCEARGEAVRGADKKQVGGVTELPVGIGDRQSGIDVPRRTVTDHGNAVGLHLRIGNGV